MGRIGRRYCPNGGQARLTSGTLVTERLDVLGEVPIAWQQWYADDVVWIHLRCVAQFALGRCVLGTLHRFFWVLLDSARLVATVCQV